MSTSERGAALRRARFDVRMWLGRHPGLHHLVSVWNWARVRDSHALITRDTELVMDGFPSSGNSFAIAALRAACLAETRPVPRVAHHLHNPGQVRAAVRRGLPTLLLVREPRATTVSALTRWPSLTADQVLRGYVGYHARLRPCWGQVVVADFDQVVSDFGAVTRRLNERFGCQVPEFAHTSSNAELVYDRDEAARARRRQEAGTRRAELDQPGLAGVLGEAVELHRQLRAIAGPARA